VVGERPIGVLHEDLGRACMDALKISRDACRKFALDCSWENSARQFLGHVRKVAAGGSREVEMAMTFTEATPG
jgi:1,2-diacylglycerol 3-alpha-glucosyltransferase/glucuronosyltransferase